MKTDTTQIQVVVVRPGQPAIAETIYRTLDVFQALVDGYVQCVPVRPGINLWCNEEGRLMPEVLPNRWVPELEQMVFGTLFFTGGVDEDGEALSLEPARVTELLAEYATVTTPRPMM